MDFGILGTQENFGKRARLEMKHYSKFVKITSKLGLKMGSDIVVPLPPATTPSKMSILNLVSSLNYFIYPMFGQAHDEENSSSPGNTVKVVYHDPSYWESTTI